MAKKLEQITVQTRVVRAMINLSSLIRKSLEASRAKCRLIKANLEKVAPGFIMKLPSKKLLKKLQAVLSIGPSCSQQEVIATLRSI